MLHQRVLSVVVGPAASAAPACLLEMQILSPAQHQKPIESKTGGGLQPPASYQALRRF